MIVPSCNEALLHTHLISPTHLYMYVDQRILVNKTTQSMQPIYTHQKQIPSLQTYPMSLPHPPSSPSLKHASTPAESLTRRRSARGLRQAFLIKLACLLYGVRERVSIRVGGGQLAEPLLVRCGRIGRGRKVYPFCIPLLYHWGAAPVRNRLPCECVGAAAVYGADRCPLRGRTLRSVIISLFSTTRRTHQTPYNLPKTQTL